MRLIFMAHPIGHEPERTENLRRAKEWLGWLNMELPHLFPGHLVGVVAPCIPLCEVWPEEPELRARGLEINHATLIRCHGIVLVGGRISPGMAQELTWAREEGLHHILDLTRQGITAPQWVRLCMTCQNGWSSTQPRTFPFECHECAVRRTLEQP